MEAGSLLTASLTRDQDAIRTGAAHRGLAPDLLWLVAELAVSPFAHALQQRAALRAATASDSHAGALRARRWTHGYCPPAAPGRRSPRSSSSHRVLRCSFCALAWELPTLRVRLLRRGGEPFVTAAPNEERKDRRLEALRRLPQLPEDRRRAELSPFPLLAIADLETMDLDVAAMERGYTAAAAEGVRTTLSVER